MEMSQSQVHKLLEREDWQARVIAIERVVAGSVVGCTTAFLGLLRSWFAGRRLDTLFPWVIEDWYGSNIRVQSSQSQILDSFPGTPDAVCSTLRG